MRLQEALELLGPAGREALRARRGLRLDPRKRLDEVEQTARALVAETDLRHSRFPPEVRLLLARLASVGGTLPGGAEDPGAGLLVDLGIAFRPAPEAAPKEGPKARARSRQPTVSGPRWVPGALALPSAFLIQVPVGEGEDPRGLRACLSMAEPEIVAPMVTAVLGHPLGATGVLALQEVWEALATPGYLARSVAELPAAEARLLDALERVGGEVTTEELLALDQAPGLYRTQSGIAVPKRGAPYMLQRRGLLFQLGVERFVVPTEVSRIVGGPRQQERAWKRESIHAAVRAEDHVPHRARYARDPGLPAVASLAMLRAWEVAVRPELGVARAALRRVAERLGEPEETITLLVALARAAGIGRLATPLAASSGSLQLRVCDLGEMLWRTYLQGGAWDESRVEPEVIRSGLVARGTSAAATARQVLLDALDVVARETWATVDAVLHYAAEDPRAVAARRIHDRAIRERPEVFRPTLDDALRAMLVGTLPALGVLDVADDGSAVRMVQRAAAPAGKAVLGRHTMEVPATTRLDRVLALADVGEPDHVKADAGVIVFTLGVGALARARARGLTGPQVEERLTGAGATAPFPPAVDEVVRGVAASREAAFMAVGGAILAEDPEVRAELRADPGMRRILLDVEAGNLLLVRADVDLARIQARLSRLGVRMVEVRAVEPESPEVREAATEATEAPGTDAPGRSAAGG